MSQENVEITERVRKFLEAFNRRDLDVFFAQLDPEVEYTPVEENVDQMFCAAELRDGRLHRIKEYTRREEALEAAGLKE